MRVLFVASECSPFAKVGGLGDVVGSLPKALKELGVDVRICLPKYQIIDLKKYRFELISREVPVKNEKVNLYKGFLPESEVILYLLENEKYFGENGVYHNLFSFKGIQRFLFFSQAVLEIFSNFKWSPQIIHCNEWHTAILPVLAKLQVKNLKYAPYRNKVSGAGFKVKSLLTIHNLSNQGKWNEKEIFNFLSLKGNEMESLRIRDKDSDFNILQQGILNADLLNTVSPTYAKEILIKEYGEGLEDSLLRRKKELFGILNGIDKKKFNPETDLELKTNYSLKNLDRKIENKIHLQEILNFEKNPEIPLLAFIGRLDLQKGVDLIIEIIPELIKLGCQLLILGVGSPEYEKKLLEFSQKYPQNILAQIKFDSVLAQKIYGGADIILIPSKFEPCGLVQMIAMRYGTIPVARKTGGLVDTIEDREIGFLFKEYQGEAFLKTIKKVLNLYQAKEEWQKLIREAMKKDFSWTRSAKEYLQLYKKLLNV